MGIYKSERRLQQEMEIENRWWEVKGKLEYLLDAALQGKMKYRYFSFLMDKIEKHIELTEKWVDDPVVLGRTGQEDE